MSDVPRKQDDTMSVSSDSEDFYSADEDISENIQGQGSKNSTKLTVGSPTSPDQRKRNASPKDKKKKHVITAKQSSVDTVKFVDDETPVAPPRRRKKQHFERQASLEESIPTDRMLLSSEDIRRANTFSWPRGERPDVHYGQQEDKQTRLEGSADSTPVHRSSKRDQLEESSDEVTVKRKQPSISIEPNESLELTEDLLENSEVESNDIILSKAIGSNTTASEVMIFIHSEDEESIDGDHTRHDTIERDLSEEEYEEEDEDMEGTDGGVVKKARTPSDSQILEATYIKNLDTGEAFPLSLADKRIPKGRKNPVDSQCDEREKGRTDSWDGGIQDDNNGDSEGATANHKKPRRKRFVKKFFKGRDKRKSDARKGDMLSGSDDETSPEQDNHSVKYKPASHNKGKLEYEHVRLKQELNHTANNESMAVWVIEFSICGRLLATAGQDSVVRVWVLRTAYQFFHDLQVKYAKFGVHSSADSLSERSSVNSSMSSDPDDDSTALKPFLEQPLCAYTGHSADVLDLSWSKNFFLLSSSMDKTVRLWHMSRKECLCCFQHVDFVTSVAFHPRDDRYFLSGSLDGKLRLWNIPDKKVALWNEIEGVGSHLITAANFCMNGKLAVAGTYDGRCIFYETEHLKYHTQIHVKSRHGKNRGRKISGIVPLPGEDKILVTSNDSRLRLYNLKDHSLTCKYKGCLNGGSQIRATFSREGEYIICGSEDNYIYVWKTHHDFNKLSSARRDRNDYYESFSAHSAAVTAVSFAPVPGITVDEGLRDVGEVIVAGDYKGHIKIYVNSEKL